MKKILLLLTVSILTASLYGQDTLRMGRSEYTKGNQRDFRRLMREGNRQYHAGKPEDAEKSYRRALDVDEKSDRATFNRGDALYRQKKYEEAGKEFEKAASKMTDKTDRAQAYHNLGNSYLQQQKLQESIEAYKQALRNNPKDDDTRYNLSYAMSLLKQQQQQQNQDNKDNKDNEDQKDRQDQDQQNQDQKDRQDQQDQKKDEMQQQQQQQQQQINREDAQRMLDAIAQDEKELQEKLQKKERAGHRGKIEKNW
ncbi:MAG: tetratricopeptide repeat protein [Bacteroidales bacterium]|jgi:tetratricopeptide (TPR) repeat protein|nr:tetratricopeptide repeat protein [Bacteroidales bacterium]